MRSRACRPTRGFTIIELLIVMTLIIILASVGMTQYRNSVTRAEEAVLKENLFRMRDAMDQFYADKNKWPADLAELVSEGYIREVPTDPMTKSKDTWQTTQARARSEQSRVSRRHRQRPQRFRSHGLDGTRLLGVELALVSLMNRRARTAHNCRTRSPRVAGLSSIRPKQTDDGLSLSTHSSMFRLYALAVVTVLVVVACDTVPLTSPTGSTISISIDKSVLPLNGQATVTGGGH